MRHWTDECVHNGAHNIIKARHYFWGGRAQVLQLAYESDFKFIWQINPANPATAGCALISGYANSIEEGKAAAEAMLERMGL